MIRPEEFKHYQMRADMERIMFDLRRAGKDLGGMFDTERLDLKRDWAFEEGEEVIDKVTGQRVRVLKRGTVFIERR